MTPASDSNSKDEAKKDSQDQATRKSGRWGADEPSYGRRPPGSRENTEKQPNPQGPEYEQGGAYPGGSYPRRDLNDAAPPEPGRSGLDAQSAERAQAARKAQKEETMEPVHDKKAAPQGPSTDNKKATEGRNPEARKETEGKETEHGRTVANRPADPNRLATKVNIPPGVSPEDARDPGNMDKDASKQVDNES